MLFKGIFISFDELYVIILNFTNFGGIDLGQAIVVVWRPTGDLVNL